MALYHDVRPATFESFVGNNKAIKSLSALHAEGKMPHVILFTGLSGGGKTTLARIVAKMVGAIDGTIYEYNSANMRGIDTAREIIEAIRYTSIAPVVYILDEFHQNSKDGMNAMLKPLEDYPPHVYFFLCTTEPQKVIAAIKTRCYEVALAPLTFSDIVGILRHATKEKARKVSKEVLEAIAEKSNGSARQALVDLEKVMYLDEEDDMLAALATNSEETKEVIDLCRALLNGSWSQVSKIISELVTTEWESVRYAVLGYMTSVLLKSNDAHAAAIIDQFKETTYNSGKAGIVLAAYDACRLGVRR